MSNWGKNAPRRSVILQMPVTDRTVATETFNETMERVEKSLLLKALEANQWHRENAANSIGLPQRTFYRKLKRHNIIRQK